MPRTLGSLKKTTKDPNAPKRPLSAFFLFSQDERPDIRKKNPSMSVGDISKVIGSRWKEVSGDVKKRYEQKAAVEKQKYEIRLAEYKKSGGNVNANSPTKGSKRSSTSTKSSKQTKKKPTTQLRSSEEDNEEEEEEEDEE